MQKTWISKSNMDAGLKEKWVAALRSGEYVQAKNFLEQVNEDGAVVGNCCLGVLCRVDNVQPGKRRVHVEINPETMTKVNRYFIEFDNAGGLLSEELLDSFGLSDSDQFRLTRMNDSGSSFTEIADFIEKNIPVKESPTVTQ